MIVAVVVMRVVSCRRSYAMISGPSNCLFAQSCRTRAQFTGRQCRLRRRRHVGRRPRSSRANFFFASSTQAANACSLTTRTAIGMKA